MLLHVGTSGWQYRSWTGRFYPPALPRDRWLEHYATEFESLEVNNTFYRLPEAETFADWRRRTPVGFVIATKASRFLTHVGRLKEPEEPVHRMLERLRRLGPRTGPILLQLPPNLSFEPDRLHRTLACFPSSTRLAVELRHPSWFVQETLDLLSARSAALCLADRAGIQSTVRRTARWSYLRMHEGKASPATCYGRKALDSWLDRLSDLWVGDEEVFVFFNNDSNACAVQNARTFIALADKRGVEVRRLGVENAT